LSEKAARVKEDVQRGLLWGKIQGLSRKREILCEGGVVAKQWGLKGDLTTKI